VIFWYCVIGLYLFLLGNYLMVQSENNTDDSNFYNQLTRKLFGIAQHSRKYLFIFCALWMPILFFLILNSILQLIEALIITLRR
jgi:hypothetical protein